MTRSRSFDPRPECVRGARRFAAEVLGDLPREVFAPIELMVSELATNCVKHSRTRFELTIRRMVDEIRVEVRDTAGGMPTVRSPGPEDPAGRGLQIVELLADDWGVEAGEESGKTVWLTVSAPGQPAVCATARLGDARASSIGHPA